MNVHVCNHDSPLSDFREIFKISKNWTDQVILCGIPRLVCFAPVWLERLMMSLQAWWHRELLKRIASYLRDPALPSNVFAVLLLCSNSSLMRSEIIVLSKRSFFFETLGFCRRCYIVLANATNTTARGTRPLLVSVTTTSRLYIYKNRG
jgi:hypothetical protein